MSSANPVVLITGANQGIGFYIAQLLSQSQKAYTILVGARNASRGEDAVTKLQSSKTNMETALSPILIDIDSHDSIIAALDKISADYGHLDILVHNAAISHNLSYSDRADWRRVFETNVIGTVDLTHAAIPLLQKSSDAKMVVVSSSMGSITMAEAAPPHPMSRNASAYRASKAAINMAMVEWVKNVKDVRIWGVDPGLCATDFAGEYSRTKGRDPKEGADIVRQCLEGEREALVGKVVFEQYGETGARPW